MERAKERRYSLEWAATVAEEHKGRYARATEILIEYYGEGPLLPARLLAFHGIAWENWKKQVREVDGWIRRIPSWHDFCKDREAILIGLERFLQENELWDVRGPLDRFRETCSNEDARSRGGGSSEEASETPNLHGQQWLLEI